MGTEGNWKEWEKLVLSKLETHEQVQNRILATQNEIRTEIALLKFKASLWGGVSGLASFVGLLLFELFTGKK